MNWPELYADIAYRTGWTIPHIRDELDLPTLDALREQWRRHPPLPVMYAARHGFAKPASATAKAAELEEQDFIPAQRISAAEFDATLARFGLPVTNPPTT